MVDVLRGWWPLLALVYLPRFALYIANLVCARRVRALDAKHDDDLPLTAGEWLEREIDRLGVRDRISVITTDDSSGVGSRDAFHTLHSVIQLDHRTSFKRHPVHWATAAHELGHARFRIEWPLLARLKIAGQFTSIGLATIGTTLVAGNLCYAIPLATSLAFGCFVAAAVLQLARCGDELYASYSAMASLRHGGELSAQQLATARTSLSYAFSTYAVSALSRAVLLTQWRFIERMTAVPRVPPIAHLTTIGWIVAAVCSLALVLYALLQLIAIIKFRRAPVPAPLIAATARICLCVFLWLAWDHHASALYAWCAMAAFAPISGLAVIIVSIPADLVHQFVVVPITRSLNVESTIETEQWSTDRTRSRSRISDGNRRLRGFDDDPREPPFVEARLALIGALVYLPLLVVFWLT